MTMLSLDGSMGEGGGQVLRSALTLALVTGRAVHIRNIRAGRPRPGLMAQHLTAVQAAAAVGRARVEGDRVGSQELTFRPTGVFPGRCHFDIGTAGATGLVLQTVALPLALAGAASTVAVTGGTHVPMSPCFHYLERAWAPALGRLGVALDLRLELAGFYPRGGGLATMTVSPGQGLRPVELTERGRLRRVTGIAAVADLPWHIAERMRDQARRRLARLGVELAIETTVLATGSPGAFLVLVPECEGGAACFTGLGQRGKPAERVADECVDALLAHLEVPGAVDPWLADQLLVPMAMLAGRSRVTTSRVTRHLLTLAEVVRAFLPAGIQIQGAEGGPGLIEVDGVGAANSTPEPG